MQPFFTCAVGGVLPFGAVFTELFFIMSSLWQHQLLVKLLTVSKRGP